MSWHLGRLAAFDLETTGVDVENDRIVTASLTLIGRQRWADGEDADLRWRAPTRYGWLARPGVPIPAGATKIHGITDEHAQAHGWPAHAVARDIATLLTEQIQAGVPIVIMNAPYDLTLLDRELQRYDLPPVAARTDRPMRVIDPRVLDKQVDQWRKGQRTLSHLCGHYEVQLDGAHDAAADALGAARVAHAIAERHPAIRDASLDDLHKAQVGWYREQAADLERYFARKGRPEQVSRAWPMIPRGGA